MHRLRLRFLICHRPHPKRSCLVCFFSNLLSLFFARVTKFEVLLAHSLRADSESSKTEITRPALNVFLPIATNLYSVCLL
jgi:hypothetical protein